MVNGRKKVSPGLTFTAYAVKVRNGMGGVWFWGCGVSGAGISGGFLWMGEFL